MRLQALIPLKRAMHGKTRLARVLNEVQRTELVRVMAEHVVGTVAAVRGVLGVHVLTSDASIAPRNCAQIADSGVGLNASIAHAARELRSQGAQALLIVHGDLPFLTTEDVLALLDASAEDAVVAASDLAEAGTNALVFSLARDFQTHFGPGSLAEHRLSAQTAAMRFHLVRRRGLACDIDEPSQLAELAERGGPSYSFLGSALRA